MGLSSAGMECAPEFYQPDAWLKNPQVQDGTVQAIWDETVGGLDGLLAQHGYHRDRALTAVEDNKLDTLVFFCHLASVWRSLVIYAAFRPFRCGNAPVCPLPVTTIIPQKERIAGEVSFRCMGLASLSHLYVADEPLLIRRSFLRVLHRQRLHLPARVRRGRQSRGFQREAASVPEAPSLALPPEDHMRVDTVGRF